MSDYTPAVTGTGARARVQRGGAFLAGMIMPNLGAFIAWGLITALVIPTGWINQIALGPDRIADGESVPFAAAVLTLVDPIIKYLLPILIGYTGGRLVHSQRGAVVGAVATMGVILSPYALNLDLEGGAMGVGVQFLGAMIIGPVAALVLKWIDNALAGRLKAGFEMLVDNFTAGIIGAVFAVIGIFGLGPVVGAITNFLGACVDVLVSTGLLPLVSIVIEPAKVLFLNNAINHGVLSQLGADQASELGKSVVYMLESNPGPGLGILVAVLLFGPRAIRPTVPAAIVVHFLGGIHEIYFPYVLMKPILIVAAIAGGATGVTVFTLSGVGLVAPASPGSIFAYILVAYPGDLPMILVGILASAIVSFVVGALVLGLGRKEPALDLDEAKAQSAKNKNKPEPEPATA